MQTQHCAPLQLTAHTSESVFDWTGATAVGEEMDSVFVWTHLEIKRKEMRTWIQ